MVFLQCILSVFPVWCSDGKNNKVLAVKKVLSFREEVVKPAPQVTTDKVIASDRLMENQCVLAVGDYGYGNAI